MPIDTKREANHLPNKKALGRWARLIAPLNLRLGVVLTPQSISLALVQIGLGRSRIIDCCSHFWSSTESFGWTEIAGQATAFIADYLEKSSLEGVPVKVGLLCDDIAFRRISLPVMPHKELAEAARWESEKYFPFRLDQSRLYIDQVDAPSGATQAAVSLIAAKSSLIDTLFDSCARAKVRLDQVDFLPVMMADRWRRSPRARQGRHLGLHLDRHMGLAIFLHNGHMEFFQKLVSGRTGRGVDINSLALELSTVIDLYGANVRGAELAGVILSGEYTEAASFEEMISSKLHLPCRNLIDLELPQRHSEPEALPINDVFPAICVALARRPDRLAPPVIQTSRHRQSFYQRAGATALITLLVVGAWQYQAWHKNRMLDAALKDLQSRITAMEQSDAYGIYLSTAGQVSREREFLAIGQALEESHYHTLLKALSRETPTDITLTELLLLPDRNGDRFTLRISGMVELSRFAPEIIVADYIRKLEALPFFGLVKVTHHQRLSDNGRRRMQFQLTMDAHV